MSKWVRKWKVQGTEKEWTVSQAEDGTWGCSCPVWRFRREECHHIRQVRSNPGAFNADTPPTKREIIPGNVEAVTVIGEHVLHPLIPFGPGGTGLLATIVYDLLAMGYSFGEVRKRFHMIPREWTVKVIRGYIEQYGRTVALRCEHRYRAEEFETRYVQVGVEGAK